MGIICSKDKEDNTCKCYNKNKAKCIYCNAKVCNLCHFTKHYNLKHTHQCQICGTFVKDITRYETHICFCKKCNNPITSAYCLDERYANSCNDCKTGNKILCLFCNTYLGNRYDNTELKSHTCYAINCSICKSIKKGETGDEHMCMCAFCKHPNIRTKEKTNTSEYINCNNCNIFYAYKNNEIYIYNKGKRLILSF